MQLILITDIFGEGEWTQSLIGGWRALANSSPTLNVTCHLISPYAQPQNFQNEEDAYHAFVASGGMDALIERTKVLLQNLEKEAALANKALNDVVLAGFSAGAAAAWCVNDMKGSEYNIRHTIGFYPGQIRHYLELEPEGPITLLFPVKENHFELAPVINELTKKALCTCWQNNLPHGYLNPNSVNYRRDASRRMLEYLQDIILLANPKAFNSGLTQLGFNYKEIACT